MPELRDRPNGRGRGPGEADPAKLAAVITAAAERLELALLDAGTRLARARRELANVQADANALADAALKLGWDVQRIARLSNIDHRELGKRRKRMLAALEEGPNR